MPKRGLVGMLGHSDLFIFSCTYALGITFGFKFSNNISAGMKFWWLFLGVSIKLDYVWVISTYPRVFC